MEEDIKKLKEVIYTAKYFSGGERYFEDSEKRNMAVSLIDKLEQKFKDLSDLITRK